MKKAKAVLTALSKRISPVYRVFLAIVIVMATIVLYAVPPPIITMRVMKTGLGAGTVNGTNGIACGGTCDVSFDAAVPVTLTAVPDAGSEFVRWEGDATGSVNPLTITLGANASVRAVFGLTTSIPAITDFTPGGIQAYLTANPIVNTPARFLNALPAEYKQNWILMTRSESLQTGTAESPRLLLPNINAQSVFSIGVRESSSYPGSHPNAVEYMQWDATEKNFRFHEIVLAPIPAMPVAMPVFPSRVRGVSIDDAKCSKCHSTNNVINSSIYPGTTGITPGTVKFKNKPNWDANDSWGGMLPFNRDRIYNGSIEAAAFRTIFNPWTWRSDDAVRSIIEQLELQPPGIPAEDAITRTAGGPDDGHINFAFDVTPPVLTEPAPVGSGPSITTNYNFNNTAGGAATSVIRAGPFVTLRHSADVATPGINAEGRGTKFFKLLGGTEGTSNQQRIADEMISHRYATGSVPIDIRTIALAITKGFITLNATQTAIVSTTPLTIDLNFFNSRNGSISINDLYNDTRARQQSLTRRRADIEKINVNRLGDNYLDVLELTPTKGLIQQFGTATSTGMSTSLERVRQEVFRRPVDFGTPDVTAMAGIYADQEIYSSSTEKITLLRYFLEPLGISVDKWSMGVRGRSRTYTFAEAFSSYVNIFDTELKSSLDNPADPRYRPVTGLTNANSEPQLIAAVNSTLSSLPSATAVPTFTDVQRIFNRSCIECHGGLQYPPYNNHGTVLDFSEDEAPVMGTGTPGASPRLARSHFKAVSWATTIYDRITRTSEACPSGLMPCGGPSLSKTDIETINRWITGGNPYTNGDPHIRTVEGVKYDFQAAGEFVLLRDEGMEIQARHTPVATDNPLGPNAYTGITSCVSLNTAFAMRVGSHRITYQPNLNGRSDPSGLQLRVDGKPVQLNDQGISLATDGRIIQTSAPGGVQINAQGGTVIIITPGWWERYQVWYLNIDARKIRATMGLMGSIAPQNWLPALPDGSQMGPMPQSLTQRYKNLYDVFGNAWRVSDSTSLFDYAPGTSAKTFTLSNWPGDSTGNCVPPGILEVRPLQPMARVQAAQLAAGVVDVDRRESLIEDLMVTGDSTFIKTYLRADKINGNILPDRPVLVYPKDFDSVNTNSVDFRWNKTTDKDGDPLTYKLYVWPVNDDPDINNAVPVSSNASLQGSTLTYWIAGLVALLIFIILYFMGLRKKPWLLVLLILAILVAAIGGYYYVGKRNPYKEISDLQHGKAYFWKVIAEDGNGGSTESETWRVYIR